jgi:hypothetical protein
MEKLLLSFFVLLSFLSKSQTNADLQIKEQYDTISNKIVSFEDMRTLHVDNNNGDFLGDGVSYFLSSLLHMFRTTGDKAYLIRFVSYSYQIQNVRNDFNNSSNHPGWANLLSTDQPPGTTYQDGLIIMPMSEFVYLVRNNTTLFNTVLPSPSEIYANSQLQFMFPSSFSTYGDYAQWLGLRVDETLDWYISNGYWNDNLGFKRYPSDNTGTVLNMQSGFAVALFYMGFSDPNNSYQQKVNILSNLYKSDVPLFYTGCVPLTNNAASCNSNLYENFPVLYTDNNYSYAWYDKGWVVVPQISCGPYIGAEQSCDYADNTDHATEDISHGLLDMFFPEVLYQNAPGQYFSEDDMVKWHNTFTSNIYAGNNDFHNSVSGGDITDISSSINDLKNRAMGWMPLYAFDGLQNANQPNVYDIIMSMYNDANYYLKDNPNLHWGTTQSGGIERLDYLGLSDVVAAQWDKQCVNLSLYKRDLVYDQDFNVKNSLTVEPQSPSFYNAPQSFADPKIATPDFTIEPNVTSNMTAGEEIILKPGFTAKAGCNFTASIIPSACTDGMRTGNPNGNVNMNVPQTQTTSTKTIPPTENNIPAPQNSLGIYPNPTDGTSNIYFSIGEKSNVTLKIVDQYGQEIFPEGTNSEIKNVETEQGNYIVPLDTKNLNSGVYLCILQINGEVVQTKKMVVL